MSNTSISVVNKKKGTDLVYTLMVKAGQYKDMISLGRGDVDLKRPRTSLKQLIEQLNGVKTRNHLWKACLILRKAISARVKRVNQIDANPDTDIVVTNGGQESVLLMCLTLLNPGDEIIVPVPTYNTYADAINVAGGIRVDVLTTIKDNFAIRPELVRKAITKKTRVILLISPNNPSANVVEPNVVREIVNIAEEYDLSILSDEIYDQFLYEDTALKPCFVTRRKKSDPHFECPV